jgi:hypothetical protein
MPDYKGMYQTLFRAAEQAVEILITAQRACEEACISAPEPEITVLTPKKDKTIPHDAD